MQRLAASGVGVDARLLASDTRAADGHEQESHSH
jgi:hypothetical protein